MQTTSSPDSPATFSERLWPGSAGWLVVPAAAVASGLVLLPVGTTLAGVVAAIALVVATVVAVMSSPRVQVAGGELRAGSAHIPLELLGTVTVLDRDGVRRAMGPDLDARAYVCLRTWVGGGVRVEVTDPADPTPYWIVSSRWPTALADALVPDDDRPATGA